jgi:hypothetical protein
MISARCTCGFTELADEEISDHLLLVFEPEDDIGNDGLAHEEREHLTCACGLTAITSVELDVHFLKAFTPDDAIGNDGRRHELVADDCALLSGAASRSERAGDGARSCRQGWPQAQASRWCCGGSGTRWHGCPTAP